MPRTILLATSNPGKLAELAQLLSGAGLDVVGLSALQDRTSVEETGASFEANARLKAEQYSLRTHYPVLADDSGLEVDALGGAPGVQSARFGGSGLDDAARNRLLLEALQGTPPARRSARFRCVLALAKRGRVLATFDGVVEGRIADAARGAHGFGYDPVFFHEPIGRTFGEISRMEKQELSHRGAAARAFAAAVRRDAGILDGPPDSAGAPAEVPAKQRAEKD